MIGVLIGGWKFVKDKSAQESFAANNPPSYRGLLLKPANHVGRGRICDAKGCRKVMKHWRRSWGIPYYFCDEHEAHIDATYNADEDSLFNSESEGEKVRNRLQGSDVGPEDDMLETPSIYRDWPMVQKGYQSLRMMNDNDNFNSEGFGSEWHHFAPCETAGCDGDIEYRDVYYCSSCGQDDTEILIGDRCPECEEVATDTATYAIFYCSDCGEDFSDEYNAEVRTTANKVRTISGKPLQLRKLKKDRDLKPEDAIERLEISAESDENCDLNYHLRCNECRICLDCDPEADAGGAVCRFCTGESIERFNAYVYRGKPMEDLNYSQRAVATKKMIDAADLEGTILQLENAIRMGLISEDELMKELQNKFGSM